MPNRYYTQIDLFEARKGQEADASAPLTLQLPLLPEGKFDHPTYGELDWSPEKFAGMKKRFDEGVLGFVPSLNKDHASQNPFAAECAAMGWFKDLVIVPGQGLEFVVEFTPQGRELVESGAYRYISAEVADEWTVPTGETYPDLVLGAALTNWPYFSNMRGIFEGKGQTQPACFSKSASASFFAGQAPTPPDKAKLTAEFSAALFRMGDSLSFEEIRCGISEKLSAEVEYAPFYAYVDEVYPDFFIYCLYAYSDESQTCLKRGYTLSDGEVTLADRSTAVEVEEVWVEVARTAMIAARKAAHQITAATQPSVDPADQSAKEHGMSLLDKFRKRFGLAETASEAEIEAAIEAEPEKIQPLAAVEGVASVPPAEFSALQATVATLAASLKTAQDQIATANANALASATTLAAERATQLISQFAAEGKITPAMLEGEGGKALRSLAETQPEAFTAIYQVAPVLIPLTRYGRMGAPEQNAETFEGLIAQIQEKDKLNFTEAARRAQEQRPELYARYRAAQAGGTN